MPRVSVVMPVFNREGLVGEAIDSILSQTYADFELIVIDDGSTDGTMEVVRSYDDRRIVTASLPANCGVSAARNLGFAMAGGDLIALMDSDNIAMPDRLQAQVSFLDDHHEIAILGTGIIKFFEDNSREQVHPAEDSVIKACLLLMNGAAMSNGTTMLRRAFLRDNLISYRNILVDEDQAMMIDAMAVGGKFHNLPGIHLRSRRHAGNITFEKSPLWPMFQARKTPLRAELLGRLFPDLSHEECRSVARFLESGASLTLEEVGIGLAAAGKVFRCRGNRLGASQAHINRILQDACRRIKEAMPIR